MSVEKASSPATSRPAAAVDIPALKQLVRAIDLFSPAEIEDVHRMLSEHLSDTGDTDHRWAVHEQAGQPIGLAFYAPERMTEGTWNLYLIAVLPNHRAQGHGTILLRYVEQSLRARGERLLLVETSGLAHFETARAFYRHNRYTEEARIRDFYKVGEDKIILRKELTNEPW